MATIQFLGRAETQGHPLTGSGVGFYGDGFGNSIAIGSYNAKTFITDSTGTEQGPEINNCKYFSTSGVTLGSAGSEIHLLQVPNYLATLNVRFEHTSAVQVQNAKLYAYDRVLKTNNPSGVTVWGAEIIHPDTVQGMSGSGDAAWVNVSGSTYLSMVSSPGTSGLSPSGPTTTDSQHDWFVALTCTPTQVGSREFAAWFELEYL